MSDLVLARTEADEQRANVAELVAMCSGLAVSTQDDAELAAELLAEVKTRARRLEDARKRATAPMLEAKREVDSWFTPVRDALASAEREIKARILAFHTQAEAARLAELAEACRLAEESAAAGYDELASAAIVVAAEVSMPSRVAGVSFREVLDFELVDLSAVPIAFLALDGVAVRQAIAQGAREIPGLRIFKRQVAASRP